MFASFGAVPVSNALSGALIELNETMLFIVAGSFLTLISLLSALTPEIRQMGLEMDSMGVESVEDAIRKTGEIPITIITRATQEIPVVSSDLPGVE